MSEPEACGPGRLRPARPITIPPLPDAAQWDAFSGARLAMLPNFRQSHVAARYRAV